MLAHGLSPFSSVAFALYSNYLAMVEGDFEAGRRYATISLSLMRISPSSAHNAATILYSAHTKVYIEP